VHITRGLYHLRALLRSLPPKMQVHMLKYMKNMTMREKETNCLSYLLSEPDLSDLLRLYPVLRSNFQTATL
jgi:hypothetical protein